MESLSGRRVLVTGGNGFVGSHLVDRLIHHESIVGILDLADSRRTLFEPSGQRYFLGCDLRDTSAAIDCIEEFSPEILFHLAAMPDAPESLDQAISSVEANVIGTINVLEGFRRSGGSTFVFVDSFKVYGEAEIPFRETTAVKPLCSHAIAKATAWSFCGLYRRLYQMDTVCVRCNMIYGPRQNYNLITSVVDSILDQKDEIRLFGGDQTRDPLFVSDAIEALVISARMGKKLPGRIINIGGGNERPVREIAAMIAEVMGSRIPIICVPERIRPTEMNRIYCDNEEARHIIGWSPQTDLWTGLQATVEHIKELRVASCR